MVDTILGRKIGMTQVFNDRGEIIPVSVAVQVGFGEIRARLVNKPKEGHFKKAGVTPTRVLREIRTEDASDYKLGDAIKCDIFTPGMRVKVTGTSKGKGFAGVVKRFHFHGGDMTHGSMIHRKPQSGGATDAARTFKGTRKPGQMGNEQVSVRGLRIVRVDPEKNLLLIEGAVPGSDGGLLTIQRLKQR